MACPTMMIGWFGSDDGPLRAADVPSNSRLAEMFDASEAEVARSAWEPGAGEPRPPHAPRTHSDGDVAMMDSIVRGNR